MARALTFVGPSPDHLELFGNKGRAKTAAANAEVPTLQGLEKSVSLKEAEEFLTELGPTKAMMIKAIHGGGGRGTGVVQSGDNLETIYQRCQSEAATAFDSDEVYVEEYLSNA